MPARCLDLINGPFYLRRLYNNFGTRIEKILVDPYQMARSVQTLQVAGLPVQEYNQTQQNLTEATEALYSALSIATYGFITRPI